MHPEASSAGCLAGRLAYAWPASWMPRKLGSVCKQPFCIVPHFGGKDRWLDGSAMISAAAFLNGYMADALGSLVSTTERMDGSLRWLQFRDP